jgi:hypothetical protein
MDGSWPARSRQIKDSNKMNLIKKKEPCLANGLPLSGSKGGVSDGRQLLADLVLPQWQAVQQVLLAEKRVRYILSVAYPAIMLAWTLILLGCGAVLPRLYS